MPAPGPLSQDFGAPHTLEVDIRVVGVLKRVKPEVAAGPQLGRDVPAFLPPGDAAVLSTPGPGGSVGELFGAALSEDAHARGRHSDVEVVAAE